MPEQGSIRLLKCALRKLLRGQAQKNKKLN
jgi:hypothetical protein